MRRSKFLYVTLISYLIFCAFQTPALAGDWGTDPKANPQAEVLCGNARFTVLTDRIIRMEWSEDGVFEDRASLAIINRNLSVPKFSVTRQGAKTIISTSSVKLEYAGNGKFTKDNLSVSFKLNGKTVTWCPGMEPKGNLKGTTRTLDKIGGRSSKSTLKHMSKGQGTDFTPVELEDGILSRDGWAIVDESQRHLLQKDDSDWGEWVAERPVGDRQDLYIFAYGHDYTGALEDFTKVAGRIPLPPKYTLGYWWSRYWIYTDDEFLAIANDLRSHKVPADVFIIDMDWHLTWKSMDKRLGHDEFAQRRGWTGYTWNRDLIVDPEGLLHDLHAMNYKTSLNLHPASGIRPYEDCYKDFVKDYLSRTDNYDGPRNYIYTSEPYTFQGVDKSVAKEGYNASVPFRMSQQAWADAYFNSVIHPLEKMGVDFWWLDWQQWIESRYVPALNNTFWLNYTFFNDKVRQSKYLGKEAGRPFIYHRWGGLGSHRYQLGFSGDTYDEWDVLQMLPYFTATASNVGYGYWGHDIGGHMQRQAHYTDPEMYTRWLQYGVFTPIFKTHSTESKYLERKIWEYPTHFEYMKQAIELRYALSPYIYDAARQAYDTGVSICRPLYYSYPEEQKAYDMDQEFMFGDNILATVLCQPADSLSGKTERKMWFPAGNDWYDMAHHCSYKGGISRTLYYSIDENPWFVKDGAIVPLATEGIQNLQQSDNRMRLLIVPGKTSCIYTHYEDDGLSQAYDTDFATTKIEKYFRGKDMIVKISPRQGTYAGALSTRAIELVLDGICVKGSINVNGKTVEAVSEGYATKVQLPELPVSEEILIQMTQVCF